jgi:hypothetical protein
MMIDDVRWDQPLDLCGVELRALTAASEAPGTECHWLRQCEFLRKRSPEWAPSTHDLSNTASRNRVWPHRSTTSDRSPPGTGKASGTHLLSRSRHCLARVSHTPPTVPPAAVAIKFNKNLPGRLGISYFACALAYVVTIAFAIMQLYPPTASPKPPMPFWSFLYQLVMGGLLRDIFQEVGTAITTIVSYVMTIIACTFLSTTIALLTLRRDRASKWLLLLNTPGILLSVYCIAATAFDKSLAR